LMNKEMARDYLERSLRCLEEASMALSKGDYAGTVRRSQEALELCLKSSLRAMGIEYPKEHDVSDVLEAEEHRLPGQMREALEEIKDLSRELASLRGPALYGYEREGIPASKAFKRDYASSVFEKVRGHVEAIRGLLAPVLYD